MVSHNYSTLPLQSKSGQRQFINKWVQWGSHKRLFISIIKVNQNRFAAISQNSLIKNILYGDVYLSDILLFFLFQAPQYLPYTQVTLILVFASRFIIESFLCVGGGEIYKIMRFRKCQSKEMEEIIVTPTSQLRDNKSPSLKIN